MVDVKEKPVGAVQRALEEQLYGRFATRTNSVAVSTNPSIIMQNNPERIGFVMVCTGANPLTFSLDRDVEVNKGFILSQLGDTVTATYIEDAELTTREFSAVSDTGDSELFIAEFIRVAI